jgi:hypothetical protein
LTSSPARAKIVAMIPSSSNCNAWRLKHRKLPSSQSPCYFIFSSLIRPLVLSTEASNNRIGPILKQTWATHTFDVISYFCHILSEIEQRYSTIEQEPLLIHSDWEKLGPYIINDDVIVETDHCPLGNFRYRPTRHQRIDFCSIQLTNYYIKEIKYKKGSWNCDVDLLTGYGTTRSTAAIS